MTPLIYYLEALDARVYVTIIDLREGKFLVDYTHLYSVLADKEFIKRYWDYNVQSVDISRIEEELRVYIRIAQ